MFSLKQGELSFGLGIFAAFVNCFGPKIQNRGSFYPGKHARGCHIRHAEWVGMGEWVRGLSLLSPRTDLPPPAPPSARLCALTRAAHTFKGGSYQSLLTDVDSRLREVK